uniref:Uncharacterized protein n=1 Tax=Tanacetum cinerariifolium TaxID=118510 RepID=A0A6L2JNB9_TANCI|nr:hypothetical protein [Tanacetum cinerariifolium]
MSSNVNLNIRRIVGGQQQIPSTSTDHADASSISNSPHVGDVPDSRDTSLPGQQMQSGVRRPTTFTSMHSVDVLFESSRSFQVSHGPINNIGSSYNQPWRSGLTSDYKHIESYATTFTLKEMQLYAIRDYYGI